MIKDLELGRFKRTEKEGDTEELVITTGVFGKSPEHLDLRAYYLAGDGEMKPTRQGVRTDAKNIPLLMQLIAKGLGNEEFEAELRALLFDYGFLE